MRKRVRVTREEGGRCKGQPHCMNLCYRLIRYKILNLWDNELSTILNRQQRGIMMFLKYDIMIKKKKFAS